MKRFVLERQNEDGGFCFCKPLESTLSETFYAVKILKVIGCEVPKRDKLVDFLRSNLRKDVYAVYYIFETLKALNVEPPDYSEWIVSRLEGLTKVEGGNIKPGGTTATYQFDGVNVLRDTYFLVFLRCKGFGCFR